MKSVLGIMKQCLRLDHRIVNTDDSIFMTSPE